MNVWLCCVYFCGTCVAGVWSCVTFYTSVVTQKYNECVGAHPAPIHTSSVRPNITPLTHVPHHHTPHSYSTLPPHLTLAPHHHTPHLYPTPPHPSPLPHTTTPLTFPPYHHTPHLSSTPPHHTHPCPTPPHHTPLPHITAAGASLGYGEKSS